MSVNRINTSSRYITNISYKLKRMLYIHYVYIALTVQLFITAVTIVFIISILRLLNPQFRAEIVNFLMISLRVIIDA